MGGSLQYNDATTLSNLSADTKTAANVLSGATAVANNPTAQAACAAVLAGTGTQANVTTCVNYAQGLKNLSNSLNSASQTLNLNTNTQLASKVRVRGVLIEESGLSVSHQLVTSDQTWSLGFTPKVMNLTLFDATLSANNGTSLNVA